MRDYFDRRTETTSPDGGVRVMAQTTTGVDPTYITVASIGETGSELFPPGESLSSCAITGTMLHHADPYVYSDGESLYLRIPIDTEAPPEVFLGDEWYPIIGTVGGGTIAQVGISSGTIGDPTTNYCYAILEGEEELSVVLWSSTTGFPSGEHAKLAVVTVTTPGQVDSDPFAGIVHFSQAETYLCNAGNGLIEQLAHSIESRDAAFLEGGLVSTDGDGTQTITFSVAPLSLASVRVRTIGAIASPARFFVPETSTGNWRTFTALSSIAETVSGETLANSRLMNFVIGIAAGDDGSTNHPFVNLPTAFYVDQDRAIADADLASNYTIPAEYRGSAVLLARVTMRRDLLPPGSFDYTVVSVTDLRGAGSGGGGTAGSTHFFDGDFQLLASSDPSATLAFSLSQLSTGDSTVTVPDVTVAGSPILGVWVSPPASSSSPGKNGMWSADANYFYVYAVGAWRRTPITAW
jgi:hypothetical protein